MEDESQKTRQLEVPKGHVTFEHVRFGYSPDKTIIHDFTAEAKPGQKVAIVGPTGAGKDDHGQSLDAFFTTFKLVKLPSMVWILSEPRRSS